MKKSNCLWIIPYFYIFLFGCGGLNYDKPHVRVGHPEATKQGMKVNKVPLERYLMGVLSKEVVDSWPLEALKAQAVASRTYVLYHLAHPRSNHYDVLSDTSDQVYSPQKKIAASIRQAVEETEGEVLTYNGSIFEAFFHSNCGGLSEKADRVWPGYHPDPLNTVHQDPYCRESPSYYWEFRTKKDELDLPLDKKRSLPILERYKDSERVLEIAGVKATDFRKTVGPTRLKSTRFEVSTEGDELVFKGQGSGHGVGLCQWGAKGMADQNFSYKDILSFYYPGAEVRSKEESRESILPDEESVEVEKLIENLGQ